MEVELPSRHEILLKRRDQLRSRTRRHADCRAQLLGELLEHSRLQCFEIVAGVIREVFELQLINSVHSNIHSDAVR